MHLRLPNASNWKFQKKTDKKKFYDSRLKSSFNWTTKDAVYNPVVWFMFVDLLSQIKIIAQSSP